MKFFYIIFICMFCISLAYSTPASSQDEVNDLVKEILSWPQKHQTDSIPVIICDEREITLEEFASVPSSSIGTWHGYIPPLSVDILGERGKRGILYVNSKKDYLPREYDHFAKKDPDWYYTDGDLPAEFPGGDDSLRIYLKKSVKKLPELDSVFANVYVNVFIDVEGNCVKSEISHIQFVIPEVIDIRYGNGKRRNSDIITQKYRHYSDLMRQEALDVANHLPKFTPATFWLQHVPYKKEIRMFFVGENVKRTEYEY